MNQEFLGTGLAFPFAFAPRGRPALARGEQRVEESIYLILGTRPGERLMLQRFGCAIHDLVFAPNTPSTRTLAVDAVRKALVTWEPRIDVLSVKADYDPGAPNLLPIRIDYRVRANNALGNLVYPFYITESFV
jgi:phage baseplate assembly protein W